MVKDGRELYRVVKLVKQKGIAWLKMGYIGIA